MIRFLLTTTLLTSSLMLLPAVAQAQDGPENWGAVSETMDSDMGGGGMTGSDWDVSVGVGSLTKPEYLGSEDYETIAVPLVDVRWRERLHLSSRDGLEYDALTGENYKLGAGIGYDLGREDEGRLSGMGDIDPTAEARVYGEYGMGPLWLEGEARQDIIEGHEGWTAKTGIEYRQRSGENLYVAMGPSVTYGGENYMKSYFGVTGRQAANSGLSRFDAEGGVRDVGFDASANYKLNDKWFVQGYGGYKVLMGDADDSPVSETDNQFSGGVGVGYKF